VKSCAYILLLLFSSVSLFAQPAAPTGVLNTYTYSDKDGVNDINYGSVTIGKSGRVYCSPYVNSQLTIIGSNYTKVIKGTTDNPLFFISGVKEISSNELWLYQPNQISVVKADTLAKTIKFPQGYTISSFCTNYFILDNGQNKKLSRFTGDSLQLIIDMDRSLFVNHYTLLETEGTTYFVTAIKDSLKIYKIELPGSLRYIISLKNFAKAMPPLKKLEDDRWITSDYHSIYFYTGFEPYKTLAISGQSDYSVFDTDFSTFINQNTKTIFKISGEKVSEFSNAPVDGKLNFIAIDTASGYNSMYVGGGNKPMRLFDYIKKYPAVFNKSNATQAFTLIQDKKNRIWAGSYQGACSIVDKDKITEFPYKDIHFINGSAAIDDKLYLFGECNPTNAILQFKLDGSYRKIAEGITGYITCLSRNKKVLNIGTNNYNGIWQTDTKLLNAGKPNWHKIDSSKGLSLVNVITITEDTIGRIWAGQGSKGIAIYYPKKDKAITWLMQDGKINFGGFSSITDAWGTVWIGTAQKGLQYYADYKSEEVKLTDIKRLQHPLLNDTKFISGLCIWGKWLIMAVEDYVCMLDLESWHNNKDVIIKYLNPHEAAFSSKTEQNTFLIDRRDSSIWFSTSDMLYQWNIKQWLLLPEYKVMPSLILHTPSNDSALLQNNITVIEPTDNSLKFSVWFQSPDNMPRYIGVAFIKNGDSLNFSAPTLQTKYDYNNLAPGSYEMYIQVCQSDGSVTVTKYVISIKKFWWQNWWVWVLIFMPFVVTLFLWMNTRRRKAILEKEKAIQEKRLANMQVVTLSNQFRPHFILNALNTIGAQMDDEPETETVLSRLGESINLIFNHAQQQTIAHSFASEWMLVKNIIHIHQLMYLKKLETSIPPQSVIDKYSTLRIPLGLLQIPVENALLHGLSNRVQNPWLLAIEIVEDEKSVMVSIADNGVGREMAATLSNYQKHGTGSKNLAGILEIVNAKNLAKIAIEYKDGILTEGAVVLGTKVIISIPKKFIYED
jgi:hypothetical protein